MATVTYYWDSYTGTPNFTNPGNLVDGNTGTYAVLSYEDDNVTLDDNTCPGTDLGTISLVQFRVYGYSDGGGDPVSVGYVITGFSGSDPFVQSSGAWEPYHTCSGVTTWSGVQNLDLAMDIDGDADAGEWGGSKAEILVTYTSVSVTPTPATLEGTLALNEPTIDTPDLFFVWSEPTIKTQGSYSLGYRARVGSVGLKLTHLFNGTEAL